MDVRTHKVRESEVARCIETNAAEGWVLVSDTVGTTGRLHYQHVLKFERSTPPRPDLGGAS